MAFWLVLWRMDVVERYCEKVQQGSWEAWIGYSAIGREYGFSVCGRSRIDLEELSKQKLPESPQHDGTGLQFPGIVSRSWSCY